MARVANMTSFAVDDVIPAVSPIYVEPLSEHVTKRFRREVLFLPNAGRNVTNAARGLLKTKEFAPEMMERLQKTLVSQCHPLIDAVGTAFSEHRPLTLSPDSIWMVIEQGFAHHVTENAEALRKRLVRHEGKRGLTTEMHNLDLENFERAISQLSSQIQTETDPVLFETLVCDFTTTTPTIRTASEVVLMDCYSSYFEYFLDCVCGIPKITVTGTREDWERIRARIEVLATYELEWWVSRLRPILDEFVHTVAMSESEQPNREFWQAIYKPKKAYGSEMVTGWIADLFPYLGEAPDRRRSHVFNYVREDWAVLVEQGVPTRASFMGEPGSHMGVAPKSFPSGLSSVPVQLKLRKPGEVSPVLEQEIELVAAFFGVEQDDEMSLSPLIGWAVTAKAPSKRVMLYRT